MRDYPCADVNPPLSFRNAASLSMSFSAPCLDICPNEQGPLWSLSWSLHAALYATLYTLCSRIGSHIWEKPPMRSPRCWRIDHEAEVLGLSQHHRPAPQWPLPPRGCPTQRLCAHWGTAIQKDQDYAGFICTETTDMQYSRRLPLRSKRRFGKVGMIWYDMNHLSKHLIKCPKRRCTEYDHPPRMGDHCSGSNQSPLIGKWPIPKKNCK